MKATEKLEPQIFPEPEPGFWEKLEEEEDNHHQRTLDEWIKSPEMQLAAAHNNMDAAFKRVQRRHAVIRNLMAAMRAFHRVELQDRRVLREQIKDSGILDWFFQSAELQEAAIAKYTNPMVRCEDSLEGARVAYRKLLAGNHESIAYAARNKVMNDHSYARGKMAKLGMGDPKPKNWTK